MSKVPLFCLRGEEWAPGAARQGTGWVRATIRNKKFPVHATLQNCPLHVRANTKYKTGIPCHDLAWPRPEMITA